MKHRLFKIRNISSDQSQRINNQQITPKRQVTDLKQINQIKSQAGHSDPFNELVGMFKQFLQKTQHKDQLSLGKKHSFDIEARDHQILIKAPKIQNGKIEPSQLKKWVTKVMKSVSSSAFHYFSKNHMNFEQAKIFCSQNIFKNIVALGQQYNISAQQFQLIDTHIQKGVLNYLGAKYPLTDSTQTNKKLQQIVHEIDNIESLSNNYFGNTNILFQYREEGNYNDLIMRMMNDLMQIIDKNLQEDDITTYNQFQDFMAKIFQKVEDQDWIRSKDKQQNLHQLKLSHQLSSVIETKNNQPKQHQDGDDKKEKARKRNQEREKYRNKVKEYTHFLIGRKIPQNTPLYTDKQIQNRNMTIKSPTILRILTKWCGELWDKYEMGYFSNRSQSIKVQKGPQVNSLLPWMRKYIDQKLIDQREEVLAYVKQLTKNNYEMQANLLQRQLDIKGDQYVEQNQKISGKFSLKVVKNLHSYIIAYLNRLIHGLFKVTKQLHDDFSLGQFSNWPSPPNILTFKVGDLMRCKCSSKQKQILRIYREIHKISKSNPEKLKIIRIKNRLRSGTNDILMNIKFNNLIICEVQLAVVSKTSDFIKCSNLFQHYFYQLQRSHFGPLTELCSIWNSLDRRSKIYADLLQKQQSYQAVKDHTCAKLNKRFKMLKYQRPFICNQCNLTYFHNNYLRSHTQCNLCNYVRCAKCNLESEDEKTLIDNLIVNHNIRQNCIGKVSKSDPLPAYGACVFIEAKDPKLQIFTYISGKINIKDYIISKNNNQIYQVDKISTPSQNKQFRYKHIIFKLKPNGFFIPIPEDQALKSYILPSIIKSNYRKQKQSISLMDQQLTTQQCRYILENGTKPQKETVKNLFLVDNKLTELPFDPQQFPNLQWLTVSRNPISSFQGLEKCQKLKNFISVSTDFTQIPKQLLSLPNIEQLTFSMNKIQKLPDQIARFKKLRGLEMDNNGMTEVNEKICECESLQFLKLQSNEIQTLPTNIHNLQKLNTIYLPFNKLRVLPEEMGWLINLKSLDVSNNHNLTCLPQNFQYLINLQSLNISKTQIKQLPSQFSKLTKLKSLSMGGVNITQIPSWFSAFEHLEQFDVRDNFGLQLPDQMGWLTKIVTLNFSGCSIGQIPITFKNFSKIQNLSLQNNQLTTIDELLKSFNKLQMLNLQNNMFIQFPALQNCQLLVKLNLNDNHIMTIPQIIFESITCIEEIKMKNNELEYLPKGFSKFNRLRWLELQGNKMTRLFDDKDYQELKDITEPIWPHLKYLSLRKNKLTQLCPLIFKSKKITDLFFSSNQITVLPAQIGQITNLKQLECNYNKITQLPIQLTQLHNLTGIWMSFNQVRNVPKFLQKISTLKTLYLDNNPIYSIGCIQWLLSLQNPIVCGTLSQKAYTQSIYGPYDPNEQTQNQTIQPSYNYQDNPVVDIIDAQQNQLSTENQNEGGFIDENIHQKQNNKQEQGEDEAEQQN